MYKFFTCISYIHTNVYHIFQNSSNGNYVPKLKFDGANGVGAAKMEMLMKSIKNGYDGSVR